MPILAFVQANDSEIPLLHEYNGTVKEAGSTLEVCWIFIIGLWNVLLYVLTNLAVITGREEAILCCNDTSSEEIVHLACHSWLLSPGSWYLFFFYLHKPSRFFWLKLLVSSCFHLHASLERFQITFLTCRWAIMSDHFLKTYFNLWPKLKLKLHSLLFYIQQCNPLGQHKFKFQCLYTLVGSLACLAQLFDQHSSCI